MNIIIYLVILTVGAIYDYKYRKIPNYIHILVLLLAILTLNIHLSGIVLFIAMLLITVFLGLNIGGGDIKFVGATAILFGYEDTLLMVSISMLLMIVFFLLKKLIKRECDNSLPFLPFFFIGNAPILICSLLI